MSKKLIELTTNLKSLKYNSGEKPYVVKDINNPPSTNGLVREVTARVDDLSRISQMLVDAPGAKYLAHEAMLQQIGVQNRIKNSGDKPLKAVLNEIGKTVVGTTKIVASTLAQVPVNGTGTHFIKGFKTDTYLQPSENNDSTGIFSKISSFLGNGGVEGAPYALKGKEVPGTIKNSAFGKNFKDTYEFSRDSKFSYEKTLEKESRNWKQSGLTLENKRKAIIETSGSQLNHNSTGQPTGNAIEIQNVSGSYKGPGLYISSSDIVYNPSSKYLKTFNQFGVLEKRPRETRVKLGDQGAKISKKKLTYSTSPGLYKDIVSDGVNLMVDKSNRDEDFVALYFYNINTQTPIQFRAFISNIDDSYSAEWQGTRYVGRAEEFYTYGGFTRDINISFKIAAATSVEMAPLYKKMNQLAAMTAPKYNTAGIMQGTVVKMNVGYYIKDVPGVITSVKYSLVEDAPWEIGLLDPSLQTEMGTSPTMLDCSVSFKAIHDFAPNNEADNYFGNLKNR